ncbi:MAG: hypothetical protein ACT4QA_23800 [Panacagrimonas sp.]
MKINKGSQLVCVNTAWVIVGLMATALVAVAGWMPPISPALNAQEVAALYEADRNSIRVAAVMIMMSGAFIWPFAVAIANQMKRIEGTHYHPLADVQLATASGTALAVICPSIWWMVAAFRPERTPELVQLVNDMGWTMFIGCIPPALVQVLAIALCILTDKSGKKVFPRWYGFFNIWAGTAFLVGEALCFFQTGPFAWDGLGAFWMAATFFFGWILLTWWMVRRAILEQPDEACA